jgi:hypothetical protein
MVDQDGAVWEKIGGAWSLYKPAQSVPVEVFDSHCNYASFAGRVCNKCGRIHDGGKSVAVVGEPDCYDAGLLGDFGGGNVEWWQDYIRAELARAHDFYAAVLSRDGEEADKFGKAASDAVKAHAAVAELIEAADELKDVCNRPSAARTRAESWRRLDRALARVRSS